MVGFERAWRGCLSLFLCLMLTLPTVLFLEAEAKQDPLRRGEYFEYHLHERLENCKGYYYGYSEDTEGPGRYEIIDVDGDNVTVKYEWEWTYTSNEEATQHNGRHSTLTFNKQTRLYVDGFDQEEEPKGPKAIWFWIDPDVKVGDKVRILNEEFTVTDLDATVWSDWLPRKGIELTYRGTDFRNDDYGNFNTRYTDQYYFDAESGFVMAERFTENHKGYDDGESAEFDWVIEVDVTSSSYDRPVDKSTFLFYYFILPAIVVSSIYYIFQHVRWSKQDHVTKKFNRLSIMRIKQYSPRTRVDEQHITFTFKFFLKDMISKALAAKDVVALATAGGKVVGVGIHHRDAKIGSIFAIDSEVNELLRKFLGCKDFFSETRHKTPENSKPNFMYDEFLTPPDSKPKDIYNLYETHRVLIMEGLDSFAYDRELIRPMQETDLEQVCEISKKVYKLKGKRWYQTLLGHGDIALVAVKGSKVVGYAFATLVNDIARLHTLTVHPAYRGQGIGKELMRARLTMLDHLGAQEALLEIPDWNLPSLRIANSFGFQNTGKMYVETIRTQRVQRNIVRR